MSLVQVICTSEDVSFVEGWLLPPLGPLGYDRVVGPQPMVDSRSVIQPGAVVLVVVPEIGPGDDSGHFLEEVTAAMAAGNPVLPIYRRSPDTGDPSRVLRELAGLAWIDARPPTSRHRLWRRLARLLPRPDPAPVAENAEIGTPIRWNAEAFSVLLHVCAERNDFEIGEVLVEAFARYAGNLTAGDRTGHGDPASRAKPYTDEDVEGDLRLLESERQFLLMRRYAEAAVRSGTTNFTVRRRYAQALIELKDFAGADDVLDSLLQETTAVGHPERFEARGLRGRMYKQRYVDAGEHAAGEWLTRAIATYWEAFSEHRNNVWHGVNAASCLRRAVRDGVPTPPGVPSPEWIARRILQILDELQREAAPRQLGVWECATRVEAYLDLEDFDRAAEHLDEYLGHPGVETFTVSSTYRQFDEVLQLRRDPRGQPILDRLGRAAERLRTGGLKGVEGADAAHLLVRVADPAWPAAAIPGLVIHARLGTVLSISAPDRTIEKLLKDPLVIAIEESRPSGSSDCAESVASVGVKETYQAEAGPFQEKGAGALVAIIDDGIDVLHEAFLDDAGRSRIVGIWDQTDETGPAVPSLNINSGRYHSAADIARYVRENAVPEALRPASTHGTHVASIAAGRGCGTSADTFAGGVAPDARLLVVISNAHRPTGFGQAHLGALEFIDLMADRLGLPVVVNMSQGVNAGAHDGKSVLEGGFNRFTRLKRGRVLVKSAGNERGRRGHARLTVPPGGVDDLVWRCPPHVSREVNLELWWDSANQYRFQLQSPADYSEWVDTKHSDLQGRFVDGSPYAITMTRHHPDNGDTLLRVQCSYTSDDDSRWKLVIEATDVSTAGEIHAWLESDQFSRPVEFVGHATEDMTLSIPGTAHDVITVGAVGVGTPVRLSGTSSFGPTRDGRHKPDICAPGVGIRAAKSGSVNGVAAGDGTSMAAPHVTGAVALLLSKAAGAGRPIPTASQVGAILRQKTRFRNRCWDRGQGFGVLDVSALLETD